MSLFQIKAEKYNVKERLSSRPLWQKYNLTEGVNISKEKICAIINTD